MKVHHFNCLHIESPFGSAVGHCILLEENARLILLDSGVGLAETKEPEKRLGKELVENTGFKFDEEITVIKQIEKLGFNPANVKDIICSHLDPDHIGGLIDFPNATIHVSKEEYESFKSGNDRYLPQQLGHNPEMKLYVKNDSEWLGLPARKMDLELNSPIYLIPLFRHTLGHCGIVFRQDEKWIFYVADAYYLRAELTEPNHPVDQLATIRAVDNQMRKETLDKVKRIITNYREEMEYFGYHDPCELKK